MAGGGAVGQAGGEFASATPDGFAIQARDAREFAVAGLGGVGGEAAKIPAALWFVEATEQQIDLLVALGQRGVAASLARVTVALMDNPFHLRAHGWSPHSEHQV
ncbi:MAG: hypothetical protein AVDCRST_MAG93-7886 [uncultured Chloroflexia bacterium]|uniref:Uncharacterized protein n=1 Tax=uncultured Chloroflexia bacterium TaxID=1672391 RepID=A0A6J4MUD4_9CHLR|nr:MAG: hypothetical protein AVDCRST_MAG93-7886 [uncultured Chloroflexia bacterium]